ncbi:MAG: hypothetical protein A2233_04965 [Candidatus Kerfeldbacteria bacterium RIFOXYA2_FULL_38_24]|uniref:Nucleotidyltransferase n=1 Tax=Candidatus Kerfeldbacteria bacterium RIFOXYB2_FULL_38_14 TaxID=1798547 RepID=A0A1G2BAD1_9BACT|nr:MAG: hypothetical protein A2233_04965 [Candidatus Kerfeldbacteria bacterium RIFOXYA2_FULL_38_24]OGY85676.1 MAG: hypothetical protein A2319_05235 [Candidatus Kerfeldbacteria bacterium RIFOXYB2_FULL_38_14]OGY88362.1 MAG: hypothetical protein A2458_02770 [Candidatus Kerfeldbacteria bacterium RIFOXYC2_FULL_38_9]
MLNKEKHHQILLQITKDIYTNIHISSLLGFKGGTAAYLIYNLPRFSVDLDFDLIDPTPECIATVHQEMHTILQHYGTIENEYQKNYTLFFLLSYEAQHHHIKIDISTRGWYNEYTVQEYLGIPMLVMNPPYMFANKLAALTDRKKVFMRDVYDIWYFFTKRWEIEESVIQKRTGKTLKQYITKDCIPVIEQIKNEELLLGLGEYLNESQRNFVKTKLKQEVLFQLRILADSLE